MFCGTERHTGSNWTKHTHSFITETQKSRGELEAGRINERRKEEFKKEIREEINEERKEGEKNMIFQHEEFDILCLQLGTEEILDEGDDSSGLWRNVREPPQMLRVELSPRNKKMLLVVRFIPTKYNYTYNQGSYKVECQLQDVK